MTSIKVKLLNDVLAIFQGNNHEIANLLLYIFKILIFEQIENNKISMKYNVSTLNRRITLLSEFFLV